MTQMTHEAVREQLARLRNRATSYANADAATKVSKAQYSDDVSRLLDAFEAAYAALEWYGDGNHWDRGVAVDAIVDNEYDPPDRYFMDDNGDRARTTLAAIAATLEVK